MPQVLIKIGESVTNQHTYNLTDEKIKYLLKFVNAIDDEPEPETDLLKQIETGLKQVKKIRNGELPRKSLKQMLNGK